MLDIFLAVALAVVTFVSSYLGVRLTIHPPQTDTVKKNYKEAFIFMGLIGVVLIGVQALRAYASAREIKDILNQEIAVLRAQARDLNAIKDDNKRPIQVKIPPIKSSTPPQDPNQDLSLKKRRELKSDATQLAAEVLTFLGERNRSGLGNFRLAQVLTGKIPDDFQQRWNAEEKRSNDFRGETVTLYRNAFENRALRLLQDLQGSGIDVSRAWYKPNSPETIQQFALDLASIARDIN